jgi:DNA-binding MarR family transcriptional regulator
MNDQDLRGFRRELRSLERQVELALLAQTDCCGVTPAQCHLILEAEEGGESSVGELAAALELDASTLSRTVDGLVKTGLLERREDPANRRRQLVCLSAQGHDKAASINSVCDCYYEGLFASLPKEEAAAIRKALPLFTKALRAWRQAGGAGSCCAAPKEGSK